MLIESKKLKGISMINLTASPNIRHAKPPLQKRDDREQKPSIPLQTHTTESQGITGKPSASHFGGVNLSEAIKGSSHVAKPQQIKSVTSIQEYMDTV